MMAPDNVVAHLILDILAASAGILVAGTALGALPFSDGLNELLAIIRKSVSVAASRRISDHWKEKAVPIYSRRIFTGGLKLAFMIVLVVAAFMVTFIIVYTIFTLSFDAAARRIIHWQPQLIACLVGIAWWSTQRHRERETRGTYSRMEQALHELTVGNPGVTRLAFTIECALTKPVEPDPQPVYVAGLARSGTTVLLNALASTHDFTSMSYRNMPFVTAPRLWTNLSRPFARDSVKRERAHGDGILVDANSPEAFEEVFWLMRCGSDYVKQLGLHPHSPSTTAITDYRRFVSNVLTSSEHHGPRYLSKNNNNLLRLGAITDAFPGATIIVPFRHPVDHADSLLRQHLQFLDIHADDRFSERYMNWLGHFEFGANFKPFLFDDSAVPRCAEDLTTREYWLRYWTSVYQHIITDYSDTVILFDYDRFLDNPATELALLETRLNIERDKLASFAPRIRAQQGRKSMAECPEQTIAVFETCREIAHP